MYDELDFAVSQWSGRIATAVLAGGVGLLGLAVLTELARRNRRGGRIVAVFDAVTPRPIRALALVAVSLLPGLGAPAGAAGGGDPAADLAPTTTAVPAPVRAWLRGSPTSPSTTVAGPPATVITLPAAAPLPAPAPALLAPAPALAAPALAVPAPAADREYIVRPGDCLWSIAARHLGPSPSPRAIDAAWRRIYVANRSVVGADPRLIRPGQHLVIPAFTKR